MDNPSTNGYYSLTLSIILGIFSWFTPERVDMGLKVVTGIGALVAAIFAARYHYYATKEKKEALRRFKNIKGDEKVVP